MTMRPESSPSTGPTSDATETSERLTGQGSNQLTLFAEAFPVSRIPLLANVPLGQTSATYGPSLSERFAVLSPDGSWRKTFQDCSPVSLDGSSVEYLQIWPRAGSMRSGTAYQHQPSALLTREIGSGSLPTPTVGDSKSARNSTARRNKVPPTGIHAGNTLTDYVTIWPTPTASGFDVADVEALLARRARMKAKHGNGNGFGLTLNQAVKMWPTPTARDFRSQHSPASESFKARQLHPRGVNLVEELQRRGTIGQLNPTWVEWLMGYPLGWTDLKDSATPSSPRSRNGSRTASKKRKG